MYELQNIMPKKHTTPPPFYRKKPFLWVMGGVLGLIIVVMLAFRFSPWPGAMIIRVVFNHGGQQTLKAMENQHPAHPVQVIADQHYKADDRAARLDVYVPQAAVRDNEKLPVVIWTHGGAWLSGDKSDAAPYFKLLADQGFVVISLNYSLAPGKSYPTAVHQLNDAYAYIQANAARYHVNVGKIVLAGDSAGAQLSSQMAAIITNPVYAQEVGVRPSLAPSQLAGVVLFCGIYKMEGLTQPNPGLPKVVGWGNDVTVWAYTGTRDRSSPLIRQMSAYYHVTSAFPDTFISGGNGDPLTYAQSMPFVDKLQSLGVDITSLFYPKDHVPSLPHEYQFTFNNDGKQALARTVQFLKQKTQ